MRLSALAALATCTLLLAACGKASSTATPAKAATANPPAQAKTAPVGTWLAGDMHVHNDHSSDGSALRQGLDGRGPGNVSVADQIGQGVLNNLSWMPLTDHRTYDQHYDPLWTSADLLLIPGEEINGSPHGTALGHVDWLVQAAVYEGRPGWSNVQSSIWDAHLQGALYGHNHPDDGQVNDDGTPNERANAVGADVTEVWNKASGIEIELRFAETRWNAGYRFGGVGASDNHFRELWAVAGPGMPSTMAFAGATSERGILDALKSGRTIITALNDGIAPVVTLEADLDGDAIYEAIAGDEVIAAAGTTGKLRVRVQRGTGTTVTIYRNPGRTLPAGTFATYQPLMPDDSREFDIAATDAQSWYYVEVRGPGPIDAINTEDIAASLNPLNLLNVRRAMTSPIFIGPTLAVPMAEQPLPADIGSTDEALLTMGEVGRFAGFPDVAVVAGVHHLVSEQHINGATRVFYRRLAADGTLAAEIDLAPASTSARFPRIVARGQNVFVVWQDERASQVPRRPAVVLRQSSDGGVTWAAEQVVRTLAGRAERPAIALTPAGAPVVVWQEIRAAEPFDVFAQVIGVDAAPLNLSRPGKSFNAANLVDTRSALYPASVWPAVAVRDDGLIAVAYHDNRADLDPLWTGQIGVGDGTEVDHWKVLVQVRKPTEATFAAGVPLGKDGEANRHPALAFAADGTLVAAWDGMVASPAGQSRSIRYAFSTDDGASFANASEPLTLAADPRQADGQHPRLGRDADGRVRVVWFDNRAADWRWRVMTSVLGTDRVWAAAEMLMAKGLNGWPATDGGAIILASTRNAQRMQRDATQQIFLLPVKAAVVPAPGPDPTPNPTPVDPPPPAVIAPVNPAPVPPAARNEGRFGGGALNLALLLALAAAIRLRQRRR